MLFPQPIPSKFDKKVLWPALVFIVQSIPWITIRVRMRWLLPLMLAYVFLDLASVTPSLIQRSSNRKESAYAFQLLISCIVCFSTILLMESVWYGFFAYGWFACSIFGVFSLWVFIRLARQNKIREIKMLTVVTLMALGFGSLSGARFLEDEAVRDVLRDMTAGGGQDIWTERDALKSGVGSYGYVYSIGMLAPVVLYSSILTKTMIFRCLFLIAGAIFILFSYRAGFTILMATVSFGYICYALSFILRNPRVYKIVMSAIIALILVSTLNPRLAHSAVTPLVTLANTIDNENYKFRLMSIANSISGAGDEYALYRTGLMWSSWKVFLQHPIIGAANSTRKSEITGHSFFFDHLAMGGLFGITPYLLFFFFYQRYMRLIVFPLSKSAPILILTYIYMYYLCTFLNPLNSQIVWTTLFVLLPGISLCLADWNPRQVKGKMIQQ